ncbi:MAG: ATP-binding protein, partial [Bdellovibrionia bacterium]
DVPLNLKGDQARLRQILSNLISNAIKFSPAGQITVRVTKLSESSSKVQICFEVIDHGIGISKEALGRIFHAFSQADASITRKFGGTGLGLSISKGLVELMNGEIGVDSEEGKGSKFWFTISFDKFVPSLKPLVKEDKVLPREIRQDFRILIADDNPINQRVVTIMLRKLGYRADSVFNGAEALVALKSLTYDLILMDCQMPEMDGYEATRQIRKSDSPRTQKVPVIALTANAIKGDREICLGVGMNDYLSKPLKLIELARVLQDWAK